MLPGIALDLPKRLVLPYILVAVTGINGFLCLDLSFPLVPKEKQKKFLFFSR
jgi:hypothetical protein